jgi:hypothetical protein
MITSWLIKPIRLIESIQQHAQSIATSQTQRMRIKMQVEENHLFSKSEKNRTADILGNRQGYAPLLGCKFSPRPMFQSYSAYTPKLAEANLRFYQNTPPDYVLIGLRHIDGHLGAMEDGPSLLEILSKWSPIHKDDKFIVFQRPPSPSPLSPQESLYPAVLRDTNSLPAIKPNELLFIKFPCANDWEPKIKSKKTYFLTCHYKDGTTESYQMPIGLAESGFIISPELHRTKHIQQIIAGNGTPCDSFSICNRNEETITGFPYLIKIVEKSTHPF